MCCWLYCCCACGVARAARRGRRGLVGRDGEGHRGELDVLLVVLLLRLRLRLLALLLLLLRLLLLLLLLEALEGADARVGLRGVVDDLLLLLLLEARALVLRLLLVIGTSGHRRLPLLGRHDPARLGRCHSLRGDHGPQPAVLGEDGGRRLLLLLLHGLRGARLGELLGELRLRRGGLLLRGLHLGVGLVVHGPLRRVQRAVDVHDALAPAALRRRHRGVEPLQRLLGLQVVRLRLDAVRLRRKLLGLRRSLAHLRVGHALARLLPRLAELERVSGGQRGRRVTAAAAELRLDLGLHLGALLGGGLVGGALAVLRLLQLLLLRGHLGVGGGGGPCDLLRVGRVLADLGRLRHGLPCVGRRGALVVLRALGLAGRLGLQGLELLELVVLPRLQTLRLLGALAQLLGLLRRPLGVHLHLAQQLVRLGGGHHGVRLAIGGLAVGVTQLVGLIARNRAGHELVHLAGGLGGHVEGGLDRRLGLALDVIELVHNLPVLLGMRLIARVDRRRLGRLHRLHLTPQVVGLRLRGDLRLLPVDELVLELALLHHLVGLRQHHPFRLGRKLLRLRLELPNTRVLLLNEVVYPPVLIRDTVGERLFVGDHVLILPPLSPLRSARQPEIPPGVVTVDRFELPQCIVTAAGAGWALPQFLDAAGAGWALAVCEFVCEVVGTPVHLRRGAVIKLQPQRRRRSPELRDEGLLLWLGAG